MPLIPGLLMGTYQKMAGGYRCIKIYVHTNID